MSASSVELRKPGRFSIRGILASAAAVMAGTFIAVLAAGGSYALWNDEVALSAGTLTSGSLGLTVTGPPISSSGLTPGKVVSQQVTVTNTGSVAADVVAVTTGTLGELEVRLRAGACSGTIGIASSTTTPTALGVFGATGSGTESQIVCVQTALRPGATAQGAQYQFVITFTADQIRVT